MFHPGAVNRLSEFLGEVSKKQRTMTPSEKALVDKKNATVPMVIMTSGLSYALPNYLAFRYILKDYPIYRARHFFTAGMFLVGLGNGIKQAGSRFLIDFCSLPDSEVAREAREIVRRDNPQHPFLLAVENKMRAEGLAVETGGTISSSSDASSSQSLARKPTAPQPQQQNAAFPVFEAPRQQQQQKPQVAAFDESFPPATLSSSSSINNNNREFVGEDAFGSDALWGSDGGGAQSTGAFPTPPSSHKPIAPPSSGNGAPVKRTWEDVQREFEQKRSGGGGGL